MSQPIPTYLPSARTPTAVTVQVCSMCRGDWDAHERAARARWDASYGVEDVEPGETLPPVTVLPVDCVVVLRRAAQGPPGAPGPQGAMGMRGERGAKGERGSSGGGSTSWEPLA